ncbi:MAG: putative transcriptional regulator [Cocleimonas sp.]|jgi:predicted transcriptional regulator
MATSESLHVRYHMDRNFIKLKPDQEIREVITLFNKHHIFGAPVVDDIGNLVGMISGSDCIHAAIEANFNESFHSHVKDYMKPDVRTVDADYSVFFVAKMFIDDPYRRYPVIENDHIVGMIGREDILKALEKHLK